MKIFNRGKDQAEKGPPRSPEQLLKDFFIPSSLSDCVYIIICLAAAYYVFTYALPSGMEHQACDKYWYDKVCPCAITGPVSGMCRNNITGMPIECNGTIGIGILPNITIGK